MIPADLVNLFAATISLTTRHAPLLEQAVLCDFITEGHSDGICGGCGKFTRSGFGAGARRAEKLGGLLKISEIEAGLQNVGRFAKGSMANQPRRRQPGAM